FGAVLFELLSSQQAFAGEDVSQTLAAVIMKEPDWNALPTTTPASIQRLVRRCLNKDPKRRLRDIGEARIAIEDALSGADVGAALVPVPLQRERPQGAPPRRERLAWAILAAVLLLTTIASVVGYLRLPRTATPIIVTEIPSPKGAQFNFGPGGP